VPDAEDVDRIAGDCEQDAVNVSPPPIQLFPQLDAQIPGFLRERAAIRVRLQRIEDVHQPRVPRASDPRGQVLRHPADGLADVVVGAAVGEDDE